MTDTDTLTDDTTNETEDNGLGFGVQTEESVPTVERDNPKSKYHQLFDMAEKSDTRIVSFEVPNEEDDEQDGKRASARASYLRRIAPDNIEVNQRGERVYVKALTEDEVAERDAESEDAETDAESEDAETDAPTDEVETDAPTDEVETDAPTDEVEVEADTTDEGSEDDLGW